MEAEGGGLSSIPPPPLPWENPFPSLSSAQFFLHGTEGTGFQRGLLYSAIVWDS